MLGEVLRDFSLLFKSEKNLNICYNIHRCFQISLTERSKKSFKSKEDKQ